VRFFFTRRGRYDKITWLYEIETTHIADSTVQSIYFINGVVVRNDGGKTNKGDSPMSEQEKEVVTATPDTTMENIVPQPTEPIITMKKLAAAGVQYGHQTRKWNPKMAPFIYGAHNGIYIVDLKKTVTKIEEAYHKMKEIVDAGGKVLFVVPKSKSKNSSRKKPCVPVRSTSIPGGSAAL
jgi:hypothetical protein